MLPHTHTGKNPDTYKQNARHYPHHHPAKCEISQHSTDNFRSTGGLRNFGGVWRRTPTDDCYGGNSQTRVCFVVLAFFCLYCQCCVFNSCKCGRTTTNDDDDATSICSNFACKCDKSHTERTERQHRRPANERIMKVNMRTCCVA